MDKKTVLLELTLKDRIVLLNGVLPQQGDFLTQSIVKDIIKMVSVTPEEIIKYKLEFKSTGVTWSNEAKDLEFKYEFTKTEIDIIDQQIKILDKENKITQENLELCTKVRGLK